CRWPDPGSRLPRAICPPGVATRTAVGGHLPYCRQALPEANIHGRTVGGGFDHAAHAEPAMDAAGAVRLLPGEESFAVERSERLLGRLARRDVGEHLAGWHAVGQVGARHHVAAPGVD